MDGMNDSSAYSEWTVTMIEAKIHEIENQLLTLEREYKHKSSYLLVDLELMHKLREIKQGEKIWTE